MYSYYHYWMLLLLKNWEKLKKLLFHHFIPFSAPPYCIKALLICLENCFSHSIPSMFHVFSWDIRTSPFCYKESQGPKFWKIFRDPPSLALFWYFKWNIFSDSKSSGNPGTLSGELQGQLGLEASENSIFQKLFSKIGLNSNFATFTKKSKIWICHKNWLVIGMKLKFPGNDYLIDSNKWWKF